MLLANNSGGSSQKEYVDSLFATYLYTGNGSTQTINNGIDLAGKGGLVWIKDRTQADTFHRLFDTDRGIGSVLFSNSTLSATAATSQVTSFNSNGYSLGSNANTNQSTINYASWTFRKADRFFSHTTVTKSAGSNATVSFPNLSTLGMVVVKRTDNTGSWYVWHRSLSAGKLLYLEQTAAEATLGHITVSGTTVTLVNSVIADGSYVIYAWAHDTSPDGLIQCGSFTTDASGNATVTLGWEPQYVLWKSTTTAIDWRIWDVSRGFGRSGVAGLYPNLSASEDFSTGEIRYPTATGFQIASSNNSTGVYLAIRRPNKPPTTGTQVYNAVAVNSFTPTYDADFGFPVDTVIESGRSAGATYKGLVSDRLRGANGGGTPSLGLLTNSTASESSTGQASVYSFSSSQNGVKVIVEGNVNTILWGFRRAPGFFDEVCYTGTGVARTVNHNLGVAPELMIVKDRSTGAGWFVYSGNPGKYLILNGTLALTDDAQNLWGYTQPTNTVFSVGTSGNSNSSGGDNYVAYLFATLPGISKVGSYTGNGSSQTINCGFTTGARFFLVKATSTTGNWWVFDSARGIVSSFDPSLALNTTNAEVTSADAVDPDPSGIIVNQEATCSINATGVNYVFLAIA